MKRNNTNKYLIMGGFLSFIFFGVGHFIKLPSILKGFCLGLSIVMYSVGHYNLNHENKLQNYKRKLFRRLFTRG